MTGELKFSELFYGKMGRRFGAWNNTNLCYPIELKSTGHAPYGVKPCQQEATTLHENISDLDEKSNFGKGDLNSEFTEFRIQFGIEFEFGISHFEFEFGNSEV